MFERRALEETPKSDDSAFHRSRWWTVLSNASLFEAIKPEAERHGFTVEIDNSCDDWDYEKASAYLLGRVRELRKKSERVCLISGGEVTVKVVNGGPGGRNQQFALACGEKIGREHYSPKRGNRWDRWQQFSCGCRRRRYDDREGEDARDGFDCLSEGF